MFTYVIFPSGITFAGVDFGQRIFQKDTGVSYLADPPSNAGELNAAELNALPTIPFGNNEVVYSETDVPKHQWLKAVWNGTDFEAAGNISEVTTFLSQAGSMWDDRKAMIKTLQTAVIAEVDWANFTDQHKKVILGATWRHFGEPDWTAVGLDDLDYIGDYNYSLNAWDKVFNYL